MDSTGPGMIGLGWCCAGWPKRRTNRTCGTVAPTRSMIGRPLLFILANRPAEIGARHLAEDHLMTATTTPAPPLPREAGASLLARLAAFRHTLRDAGFIVGLGECEDAANLLASGMAGDAARLRSAFRALFCSRPSDWEAFEGLFDAFWLGRGVRNQVRVTGSGAPSGRPATFTDPSRRAAPAPSHDRADLAEPMRQPDADDDAPQADGDGPKGRMEGASRAHALTRTDFRSIADAALLAEAHALAERLARQMRARLTRRHRPSRKARRIDLRRTIHRSIARGGVPIDLIRRTRKPKPLRLVLLLDASGSMSLYTSVFVRFMHGVLDHARHADAFVFHTRLVEVSDALRDKDATRALERLSLIAEGVGGGTRIGESLATFNRWHAARVLHSRSCLIIVSDGYDTGEPKALAAEMARLRRRCRRIVWLNPMLGWQGYEPSARGMQAALPFVDLFAPAHDLQSLAALEPYLSRI